MPSFDPCTVEARTDVKAAADVAENDEIYDDGADTETGFKTLVDETDITSVKENANYDEMTQNKISGMLLSFKFFVQVIFKEN